jgi:hypothetical protein
MPRQRYKKSGNDKHPQQKNDPRRSRFSYNVIQ